MMRIFAAFFLVLLLPAAMTGVVWQATRNVSRALRADAISQGANSHIDAVRAALAEALLRMAVYLRVEGVAERDALSGAIERLQALTDVQANLRTIDVDDTSGTIRPVRAALSDVADATTDRRFAVAMLVAASSALANSGTALAYNGGRQGDKALAEASTTLMADIDIATMAGTRAAATEDQVQFATAATTLRHGRETLQAIAEATTGSARLQRLASIAGVDFDSMQAAVANVRAVVARRNVSLAELTEATSEATTAVDSVADAISKEQLMRRTQGLAAARSLQSTVLWTSSSTCAFGLMIAFGLGLSITRPLRRLAVAMRELANGALDTRVPGITKRDELGAMAGALMVLKDRSAHQATHDSLTGLPNRGLFHDCLGHSLVWSRRHGGSLAVFYIDLDRFKDVNDTLGHAVGDRLLMDVAARLRGCLRESDTLARLGGDEFGILQVAALNLASIEVLGRRIVDELSGIFEIEDQQIVLSTSVGIAVRCENDLELLACDAGVLLQEADVALYRAKEEGRGTYRFFEPQMNANLQARRMLETDIREALAGGQFRLHYQPQIGLRERHIVGAEALLRWYHPRRGEVSPVDFIPLAEETGLIIEIGEWVLFEACRQASIWCQLERIAVNVSPVQFRRPGLVETVQQALRQADLAPERLEIEITEGVLLTETPETLSILHRLRKIGVSIAMDDFGTGYSSLGYLQKFRFDRIKIDRSFVCNLGSDDQASEIVRAVVRMSHAMGIQVIAEGVEQQHQVEILEDEGCEEVQGYLFGKPLSAKEFSDRLSMPLLTC